MPVLAQKRKAAVVVEPVKEHVEETQAMDEDKPKKGKGGKVKKDDISVVVDNSPEVKPKDESMQEEQIEEVESPEDKIAREEKETATTRTKELKAMSVDQIKELVSSKGLEVGKKDDMIEAIVHQEANARADAREHAARIREVMMTFKNKLEAQSLPDLKDLCTAKGITSNLTKPQRVELLLKLWQEEDGINKALNKIAREARENEFQAMDKATLQKFCGEAGVDAYVKEVIVERLLRCEVATGRFARPTLVALEEEIEVTPKNESVDLVDALLATEAARKKEMELKKQQQEAEGNKRNELKGMNVDALKKLLVGKGRTVEGKKDELVETAFDLYLQEEAMAAKKNKLRALPIESLNKLVLSRGLELGKKDDMVESLLALEAQTRESAAAYATKFQEVLMKVKEDMESKSPSELKELCTSKGLKAGNAAVERVERLVEAAKECGEVDKMVVSQNRDARRQELIAMDYDSLLKLCSATATDPLLKEVMVERLMAHESEFGRIKLDDEPKFKKARVSRK
jgi:hypothetical protein